MGTRDVPFYLRYPVPPVSGVFFSPTLGWIAPQLHCTARGADERFSARLLQRTCLGRMASLQGYLAPAALNICIRISCCFIAPWFPVARMPQCACLGLAWSVS